MSKPVILISACLEHDACRYDGSMIGDLNVRRLKDFVTFKPICPEMAIGLPSPREAIRVVKDDDYRLVSSKSGVDYTDKMNEFSQKFLQGLDVDGVILKAKSPSCGVSQVKVYKGLAKSHSLPEKTTGFFAKNVKEKYDVPLETEARLSNYDIREKFFISIFTLNAFKEVSSIKELVKFHSDYKYLFMCYSQKLLKEMGNIVANHEHLSFDEVREAYFVKLKQLLNGSVTTQRRINVLTHIYGYFKDLITDEEKVYYFDTLDDYLNKKVPYNTVLSILKMWALHYKEEYLLRQTIFNPFPKELYSMSDSGKVL